MEKLLTVVWYDQRKIYSVGEVPGKGAGKDGSLFGRNPPNRKANAQAFIYKGEVEKKQQEDTCSCGQGCGAGEPSQDDAGSIKAEFLL